MFLRDILVAYMNSDECARSEVTHFAGLVSVVSSVEEGTKELLARDAEEVTPRQWSQWRRGLAVGGWRIGEHVSKGWSRNYINCQMRRIRKALRWGAIYEHNSKEAYDRFCLLTPLKPHQVRAREHAPITSVEWEDVVAIKRYCSPMLWAMVHVQWLTGMRSNELVRLSMDDILITKEQDVWLYCPMTHKTAHRGKTKTIVIGPQAIAILKDYQPEEGGRFFVTRHGGNITTGSYRMKVSRAITKAKCNYWHPHQLRHSRAKLVDEAMGREAAAAVLGDTLNVASIYTERNVKLAIDAARRLS